MLIVSFGMHMALNPNRPKPGPKTIRPCFKINENLKIPSPYNIQYYTKHKFEIEITIKRLSKSSISHDTKLDHETI